MRETHLSPRSGGVHPESANQFHARPLTRRGALGAAAAALTTPAFPTAQEDPILPIYREWRAARQAWFACPEGSPEAEAANDREWEAEAIMIAATPTTLEGAAALIHLLWTLEGPCARLDHPSYAQQCDEPPVRIITALWRYTTGLTGSPPPDDA